MKAYPYEFWRWKYNQFLPCLITEWCGGMFWQVSRDLPISETVKVHYCVPRLDRDSGELVITDEGDMMLDIRFLRNVIPDEKRLEASWEDRRELERFNILRSFSHDSMLYTRGFDIIVDEAVPDKNGNIRVYYKYIQCDETMERVDSAWSWINSYGCQFKKVQPGYNFITVKPEDYIIFRSFVPSRLEEHRETWYFEDPIDRDVIIDLERLLGYTREDGKTWMEYFWTMTDGKHLAVKVKDSGLSCIDMTDPKNPKQLVDPENPGQILLEPNPEVFIEKVVEYAKTKKTENSTLPTTE